MESTQLLEAGAASAIAGQFPGLLPLSLRFLGEGFDSIAFEVNGSWVFRFPKRADVESQLMLEQRVLAVLAERSPIGLPRYTFMGRPSPAFPRHFGGYAKLRGEPAIQHAAPPAGVAEQLGTFLSWLHAFPPTDAAALGVPREDAAAMLDGAQADALDLLDDVKRVSASTAIERWRSYLRRPPAPASSHYVLAHNDLAAEHVLCVPGPAPVAGIIDWSDLAITDVAVDFAGLFHWGGSAFVNAVLASYSEVADDAMLRRARFLGACRGAADVGFGMETGRPEYIAAGLRALELCADD